MLEKALAQPLRKSLQIYNSAEGNNYICSVFAFNSMLPPQHTGSTARNKFVSILAEEKSSFCFCVWIRIASPRVAEDCGGSVESIVLCPASEKGGDAASSELDEEQPRLDA
ncbi:uncharacterized protein DS421_13g400820 [Arachis hypogaea]|nr:uncharacterized protein DS421_13g400820 [Arachis hypogaea]